MTSTDVELEQQLKEDVFQLTVSCFEDLADRSSRSYNKRASILETVSRVRSCVIMLDLECDELIVKMFELFLNSVRDYHLDSVFSSMESIMMLVIDESAEISVEMLKPLLARVRKDPEGVLPVAHKLGKGVLLKSADKLKPYMMPALTSIGESLDMYHEVVAAVCEGTTANFEKNDDNDYGIQLANECNLEKGSVDEAHQADESKVTTTSSDHMEQMAKEKASAQEDWLHVFSDGVNVTVREEASADQESKKPKEDKEDTDDSDADKLVKEKSKTEKTSKRSEKKSYTVINSAEPFDKENDNDVKEPENQNEEDGEASSDSDAMPLKMSAKNSTSKEKDDGKKNVAEKDQAKSLSGDERDISSKFATKSTKREGNSTETPKRECCTGKDEVTIKCDESLIGTKVKVWWPEDGLYYEEAVVEQYYPDKKMHKISYVDGATEVLSLKTRKWEIWQEFSIRDYKGQNTKAQSKEASPEIHKNKKSKTDHVDSQEKIKGSAKKVQNPPPEQQPQQQRFAVRHARLPPLVEDVLHDHSRRLQRMEDLIQWLVQLEIERARADGFPIPPLPPPPQDF